MTQRQRSYISQSFAVTEEQLAWLSDRARTYSAVLGERVSMSELVRLFIDQQMTEWHKANEEAADGESAAPQEV